MTNILVLESSLLPPHVSASRRVTAFLVAGLSAADPHATIVNRDLAANPLDHIRLDLIAGSAAPPETLPEAQARAVATSQALIDELLAADTVIIGAPMYNFSIPSTLKAWIDNITIAGKTFRYTAEGRPEGLVHGKRVFIIASRGGIYSEGPLTGLNFTDPYLRATLGLLGMTDVTVILVERQKMGTEAQAEGFEAASKQVTDAVSAERG